MVDMAKLPYNGTVPRKSRSSNIELLRILAMLSIVAHHYVVNSGLTVADGVIYSNPDSIHSLILLLAGAWGKIGINSFVLITGYFMCKSNITLNKFLKLILEIMFYRIIIALIFWITGYSDFSIVELVKVLIPVRSISNGFTSAYIIFFLFIPFLNILVKNMNERQHIKLLILIGFLYVFLGTFPIIFSVKFNYVSWFIVLYFISAYVRLYPKKAFEKSTLWGLLLAVSIILSIASVVFCARYGNAYVFVTDSNTLLAVLTALSAFMFFKNLTIKNSKIINTIASATFGVLLIHASSDTMRSWLWGDLLKVVETHTVSNGYLHMILSVLGVYIVCTLIDLIRIYIIERPFFQLWNKRAEHLCENYKIIENRICSKLHIQ